MVFFGGMCCGGLEKRGRKTLGVTLRYIVRVTASHDANIVRQGIKPLRKSATGTVKISNTASLWVAAKNSLVQIPA
jgi:hypothetical protein